MIAGRSAKIVAAHCGNAPLSAMFAIRVTRQKGSVARARPFRTAVRRHPRRRVRPVRRRAVRGTTPGRRRRAGHQGRTGGRRPGQAIAPASVHPIRQAARHFGLGRKPIAPETRTFLSRNRGKRSLPLALRHPEAKPVIDALLDMGRRRALMNFRPGLAEELGLGASELCERFSKSRRGFRVSVRQPGSRSRERARMDIVVQARSGLMAANGRVVDGRPATGDPVSAGLHVRHDARFRRQRGAPSTRANGDGVATSTLRCCRQP